MSNCVNIWALFCNDATHLFELGNNSNASIKAVHAIKFSTGAIHYAVLVHDHNKWNVMTNCHLEVIWIVGRRYFNSSCSKFQINIIISNNRNFTIAQRQLH